MRRGACFSDVWRRIFPDIEIRRAVPADAPLIVDLWRGSQAWQLAKGKPPWSDHEITLDRADERLRKGEMCIGLKDDTAFGCMALQTEDRVFWPDRPARSAIYLHKLATHRMLKGQGLGRRLIEFAFDQACEAGLPLRLDCAPESRLMAFYESCGLRRVEDHAVMRDGFWVIRYEGAA